MSAILYETDSKLMLEYDKYEIDNEDLESDLIELGRTTGGAIEENGYSFSLEYADKAKEGIKRILKKEVIPLYDGTTKLTVLDYMEDKSSTVRGDVFSGIVGELFQDGKAYDAFFNPYPDNPGNSDGSPAYILDEENTLRFIDDLNRAGVPFNNYYTPRRIVSRSRLITASPSDSEVVIKVSTLKALISSLNRTNNSVYDAFEASSKLKNEDITEEQAAESVDLIFNSSASAYRDVEDVIIKLEKLAGI